MRNNENAALVMLESEHDECENSFLTAKEHAWLALQKKKAAKELHILSGRGWLSLRLKTELGDKTPESELEEAAELLERFEAAADKDGLTRLENRRGLFKKGVEYLKAVENSSEKTRSISVVSMDIDFFKAYNEISHTFGDVALQKVGQVLIESTKDSGFSARLGGEEIFILVEKQMSKQQIIAKALEIKSKIQKSLNDFFKELDAQIKTPNATIDFFENSILTESRNRVGFNLDMAKKPAFASAKARAKKINAFEFTDEIEPADFVLKLKGAIKAAEGDKKKSLEQIKKDLGFEIGTITVAAVHVEFDKDSDIAESDLAEMLNAAEIKFGGNAETVKELKKNADGKTYKEIYKVIGGFKDQSSNEAKEFWRDLIEKNREKRFGRIVDRANALTEKQKRKSRNSFAISSKTMKNLDSSDKSNITGFILNEYNLAQKALEKILRERVDESEQGGQALVADDLAKDFLHMGERINPAERERFDKMMKTLRRLQADRYYDPLTLTKNYEYLSRVIPGELRKADKKGFNYAMISLDLDNLKAINEIGGHKLGDIALMTACRVMQKEMNLIPEQLKNKIEQTGLEPSVIRATGGEEFILTLPGLTSEEAREIFNIINEKMSAEIKKICKAGGYEKKIKKYIGKLDFQTGNGRSVKRSAAEIDKFGSATAGAISLRESRDYLLENGRLNAGKMRQIADTIGEKMKKRIDKNGNSGRGKIWGIESLK